MTQILLLDTTRDPARIAVCDGSTVVASREVANQRQLAERLLAGINAVLETAGLTLGQLDALAVVQGPGAFTGLRIGIATANALAYANQLPMVGVRAEQADSLAQFAAAASRLIVAGQTAPSVLAEYGQPPKITPPKTTK